ncbi:MAG: hypothetical protein R3B48_00830 [Kofleriaceae bacterium]
MQNRVLPLLASLLLTLGAAGCPRNISGDSATGEDGKNKGAKAMVLENGVARASGIVTYPGGDRADWKSIELPKDRLGTLELKLTWQAPRRGLQLSFDVYDEFNYPVAQPKRSRRGKTKRAEIEDAHGTYFIRVYAQQRGDAGKYRLTATYTEKSNGPEFDPAALDLPDPPALASVPDAIVPCDEISFDIKNPQCRSVCPLAGAPPGWPACAGKCPNPPTVDVESCLPIMPCPTPPDRRVAKCKGKFPKCDPANIDPENPNCDNFEVPPTYARVLSTQAKGDRSRIVVSAGAEKGVKPKWIGEVLRGGTDIPLEGGRFIVASVRTRECVGEVALTPDTLKANPRVRLRAPSP